MHVHNVKLSTGHHAIEVEPESAQVNVSNALNDALVNEDISVKDLRPIVFARPYACVVQECGLCAKDEAV
jgi:hypothetical protein